MNKLTYILILTYLLTNFSCKEEKSITATGKPISIIEKTLNTVKSKLSSANLINENGKTIATRFNVPDGFEREKTEANSYGSYLQNLPLKIHGTKVHFYNGGVKPNMVYEAVIDLDVGTADLQQCADAVMRLRGEYLYHDNQHSKLHFNFTNGFKCDYNNWKAGNRIKLVGNNTSWVKKAKADSAYPTFRKYMNQVFMYAGTASLAKELKTINTSNMQIGDVFIIGGFPGHAVIVVDMAINKGTGEKLFMLAQSYMPAQDIQVLKNYNDSSISPWYNLNFGGELQTPEWSFSATDLKRFK